MSKPERTTSFRPELQALRALAVLLVVTFHIWPGRVPGGYVGVDVFFVLSGFLMTAHLTGELARTGGIRLRAFWARRIRRLLPAATTVLVASAVATLIWIPLSAWRATFTQIVASALYLQNWILASESTDYFAQNSQPTIVQHYWSLSLEEQFYVVWPIALIVGLIVARLFGHRGASAVTRSALGVAIIVFVLSLSWSILSSHLGLGIGAYFDTTTRMWEFAVGAILALTQVTIRSVAIQTALGWLGTAAIIASALFFDGGTVFPGWLALVPVLGTAAVVLGGNVTSWTSVTRWGSSAPVQYLGNISYSVYLWHWPLVVLVTYWIAPEDDLRWWGLGIIVATVALAALTKKFIEDPTRASGTGAWSRRLLPAFGLAVGGAVTVAAIASVAVFGYLNPQVSTLTRAVAAGDTCVGARASAPGSQCVDPFGAVGAAASAAALGDSVHACHNPVFGVSAMSTCVRGSGTNTRSVALVGDSHAMALGVAINEWAIENGYRVLEYTRDSCPGLMTAAPIPQPNYNRSPIAKDVNKLRDCASWSADILADLASSPSVKYVVFTAATDQYVDHSLAANSMLQQAGVKAAWQQLLAAGKRPIVIRDAPGMDFGQTAPRCVEQNPKNPLACSTSRSTAVLEADPMILAADEVGVPVIDFSNSFCNDTTCYATVGGLVAYWDRSHMTAAFVETLSPQLFRALDATIGEGEKTPQ